MKKRVRYRISLMLISSVAFLCLFALVHNHPPHKYIDIYNNFAE